MSKTLLIVEKNPSGSIGLRKAKERNLNIVFLSSNKYYNKVSVEDRKYIDSFIEIDTNNDELVIETVKKLNAQNSFDGVMTFLEFYVPLAARIAKELGLPGISLENAYCARNKFLMREKLKEAGVPIPLYKAVKSIAEAKEFAESIKYPNIIKPVNLAGSRSVIRNDNELELEENFNIAKGELPPFGINKEDILLLEEYMDGPEFSVESVSFNGNVSFMSITKKLVQGKNTFVEIGHVVPAILDKETEEQIYNIAKKAILALGIFNGTSHTEVKLTKNGPQIVEIAARLGGDHIPELVEIALGVDLWSAWLSVTLGEEPNVLPKKQIGAAISYLTAVPGVVKKIENIPQLPKENIHELHVETDIGKNVRHLNNSSDRLGYVIATGKTSDEAESTAKNVSDTIKIITDNL